MRLTTQRCASRSRGCRGRPKYAGVATSAFELGYPHEMLGRALTRTVVFGSAKVIGLNDR
jgi:hypothetical protein